MALARYQVIWLVCCWLSSASASHPRGSVGAEAPAIDRLASMRVGELQHLLDQTNSKCPTCVEKGDYVRRCQQVWQELRRAPATVHVVSSEFDYLHEGSEYEWVSGPYDVTEPNSSWVIRDWRRPRYERRRCAASDLTRHGSCPVMQYLLGGPSWTGWVIGPTRDAHASPELWYHRADSNALLPQNVSTPWDMCYAWVEVPTGYKCKWERSKLFKILAGDAGRVAWEKTQRTSRQRTDERGRTGLLRAACNGKPLNEARGCLMDYPPTLIDGRDDEGRTALMCAAELGNAPLVHVLLQAGANPKLEDSKEYRTARELAAEAGHHALAAMLADRMAVGRSSSSAWLPSAAEAQLAVGFVSFTNFSARCGLSAACDRWDSSPCDAWDLAAHLCARSARSLRKALALVPLLGHESQTRGTLIAEAPIEMAGEHWTAGVHMLIDAHWTIDEHWDPHWTILPWDRKKLRLALRRNNASALPLLANLSITPIDGAAVSADSVENFEPLSNVDSFQRFSGVHNHQFRSDHPEASVRMDVDRLTETGTSFLQDGSMLVMLGMQLQPVVDGAFTWVVYDFPSVQPPKKLYSPVFQRGSSNQKWCAVSIVGALNAKCSDRYSSRFRRILIKGKSSYAGIYLSSVPLGVGRDEWHATTRAHVQITVHNQLYPSLSISRGAASFF